jgi:hypothetical protein
VSAEHSTNPAWMTVSVVERREIERSNHEQLLDLLGLFDLNGLHTLEDIFLEAAGQLPQFEEKISFKLTDKDDHHRIFNYGCDFLEKKFEEEFMSSF